MSEAENADAQEVTPDEDVTQGLALTEGIEDALAVLDSGFAPVWACLSAGTLAILRTSSSRTTSSGTPTAAAVH